MLLATSNLEIYRIYKFMGGGSKLIVIFPKLIFNEFAGYFWGDSIIYHLSNLVLCLQSSSLA